MWVHCIGHPYATTWRWPNFCYRKVSSVSSLNLWLVHTLTCKKPHWEALSVYICMFNVEWKSDQNSQHFERYYAMSHVDRVFSPNQAMLSLLYWLTSNYYSAPGMEWVWRGCGWKIASLTSASPKAFPILSTQRLCGGTSLKPMIMCYPSDSCQKWLMTF